MWAKVGEDDSSDHINVPIVQGTKFCAPYSSVHKHCTQAALQRISHEEEQRKMKDRLQVHYVNPTQQHIHCGASNSL